MNSFKNLLITLVVICLTVGIAEAKKKPAAEKSKTPAAESNAPAEKSKSAPAEPKASADKAKSTADVNQSSAVAATVNGTKITEGQINKILQARMEQLAGRIPENMRDQYSQQLRKRILEQLIIEELLTQKEKKKNVDVNQADLDSAINKMMKEQNLTVDEFKSLLKAYGTTFAEYQDNMRKKLAFEKMMESEFAGKITKPTDEQEKTYYNENIQMFQEPESIHSKHILVTPSKSGDPNKAKAVAKAKAEGILKKLKAGADFNDLAKKDSNCPSAANGGDLGTQPKGSYVPEFEKAAYALKPGQLSDVVETQFGYHIIKLIAHNDANTVTLEKARDKIAQALTDKQKEEIVVAYIQQIKKEADIKYTNPADNLEMTLPKAAAPARPEKSEPNSSSKSKK
jgi:peptidyl-prolyl cis-trans isomerase C